MVRVSMEGEQEQLASSQRFKPRESSEYAALPGACVPTEMSGSCSP